MIQKKKISHGHIYIFKSGPGNSHNNTGWSVRIADF